MTLISKELGICGIGAVTGYGWGIERLWEGLAAGRAAATQVDGYGRGLDQTAWLALVPEGGDPEDGPSRFSRAMRAAAREAIGDAERRGWRPGRRVGLIHAVVLGEVDLWRDFYLHRGGRVSGPEFVSLMPSTPISMLMKEFGFHGPAMGVQAMCASGNTALLMAKNWLDTGMADDVVVVATDLSATPQNVDHFVRLRIAVADQEPLEACRPFQEGGSGFGLGEASVAFVLSARSATPYVHLLGGAMGHDAHHVISIDPALTELSECFAGALENAGVRARDVRYLNTHGSGTRQCDKAESAMVEKFFPPETGLYSIKPFTGHCQSAAAAVEVAVATLSYERGFIPAPPIISRAHPQLLNGPTPISGGITVKSSMGMGGYNSVIVVAPPE
jgi:3-oxoacyl-[acyl-carrier-protein] synthase II